jgi:hypothetical protein
MRPDRPSDDLTALVEAEERLERAIAVARDVAAVQVVAIQVEVAVAEAAAGVALGDARRVVDAEVAGAAQDPESQTAAAARESEIVAAAWHQIAGLEQVVGERLDQVATSVLRGLARLVEAP